MMLRRLRIENFRGIRRCEWRIDTRLVALVGPGDSAKTTLLDAVGLVLSPSHNPAFTDADFHGLDLANNIVIEAVITDLPDRLVREDQLGRDRSGLMPDGTLVHDPLDEAEECLVVRLTVTSELEPQWEVRRPGSDESRSINASQRRRLGFFRLGERPDYHLRWARGSALSGLTGNDGDATSLILDAHRAARSQAFGAEPSVLHAAADRVAEATRTMGSVEFNSLRPGLEPSSAASAHSLMLHHGDVPLSSFGLGTRRLTSLAIQDHAMDGGSIIAIDEIEHGLEPHRLAGTLQYLKGRALREVLQVIATTHSPVAVETLSAEDLVIVRSGLDGSVTCHSVPADLDNVQGTIRSASAALLGRRVLVGEGATEVGFVRALIRHWDSERVGTNEPSAVALGTVLVNGRGSTQPARRAEHFQALGYPTHLLVDNDDRAIDASISEAMAHGVAVSRWSRGNSLEAEVVATLALEGVQAIVDAGVGLRGEESVRNVVRTKLNATTLEGVEVKEWQSQSGVSESALRTAIAAAATAKDKEWFKREDRGEHLGEIVIRHRGGLEDTPMMNVLASLRTFIYNEVGRATSGTSRENA